MDGDTSPCKLAENERQSYWKKNTSIYYENRQSKHSTRPLLVQNANAPTIITVRARENSTNHGPRQFPWTFTRGWDQGQVPSPPHTRTVKSRWCHTAHVGGVSGSLEHFRHLPKSAMFNTIGYSPGFLLKIGQFRTLANSPEMHTDNPASSK